MSPVLLYDGDRGLYRAAAGLYHWVTPRRRELSRFVPKRWRRPLEEG